MRLTSERIVLPEGCSWGFHSNAFADYPFNWHCHREYELTLTLNARGERYVGDSIAPFDPEDLVLIGSNLPHSWKVEKRIDASRPVKTFVLWFTPDWMETLSTGFVEFDSLGTLFRRAERGLLFSHETRRIASKMVRNLDGMQPRRRFIAMLDILAVLLEDDPQPLASASYGGRVTPPRGQRKLDRVLAYIHRHYTRPLSIDEVSQRFGMSQSTFFRFFRRHMAQNFSDYVASLRIGRACALLLERDDPIYRVAERSGYQNLSHFYRQFRSHRRLSPAEFRKRFNSDNAGHPTERCAVDPPRPRQAVPIPEDSR